ncbi:hypothetical protein SAMN05421810_108144 [Amycolatopsis arida]|uniref:Prenyltransferase and squalene oxidase repeat-containing protein n=2 Tax=Amycolatopsis arida TaxID=587909 RepID=A0A1I5Z201_9PSEU|nr:hypothetical protein CLV69_108144 [Amycolatopsis arida]SFQ50526.1 hypothetical protein SAMN05421810_108144 [Amycolatopsis arida]
MLIGAPAATAVPPSTTHGTHTASSGGPCTPRSALDRLADYIRTQQAPDGSFPGIGPGSTADAVYSLAAAGVDPSTVTTNGNSPIDYIYSRTDDLDTGVAARFLLALIVSGHSTTAPNGIDFVRAVESGYEPATGLFGVNLTAHSYAMIALRAAGRPVPSAAADALRARQRADGGWSHYVPARNSDTNTTAVALVALRAVGGAHPDTVRRALAYLRTQQAAGDGGFTFSTEYGTASDTNSTALVVVALRVLGQDLAAWAQNGNHVVTRLLAFQNPSGAFRHTDEFPTDNPYASYQAGPALAATLCRTGVTPNAGAMGS